MALRWFVVAALVTTASIARGELAAQVTTKIPTKVPTAISPKLPAEQPARNATSKVMFEGCIARAQRDGSTGGTATGTTSSPNTANPSEKLDVFVLTYAQQMPRDPAAGMEGTAYALEGREQEVGLHADHRVQISGTLAPARPLVAAAPAAGLQRILVDTVTMTSVSCGGPASK